MHMQVRTAVTKFGCKMADSGSVLFNFQRQGLLFAPASFSEDEASTLVCMASHVMPLGWLGCQPMGLVIYLRFAPTWTEHLLTLYRSFG